MTIKLLTFASIADILGTREQTVDLENGSTVDDLLARIASEHTSLQRMFRSTMISVNQDYVERSHILSDGDEVALIPPVSGGSDATEAPRATG